MFELSSLEPVEILKDDGRTRVTRLQGPDVAVILKAPVGAADEKTLQRFRREAALLAKLAGPG